MNDLCTGTKYAKREADRRLSNTRVGVSVVVRATGEEGAFGGVELQKSEAQKRRCTNADTELIAQTPSHARIHAIIAPERKRARVHIYFCCINPGGGTGWQQRGHPVVSRCSGSARARGDPGCYEEEVAKAQLCCGGQRQGGYADPHHRAVTCNRSRDFYQL